MARTPVPRLVAALVVFGLGLGAAAPAVLACDMDDAAGTAGHHGVPALPEQPPCHPPTAPAHDERSPDPVPMAPMPAAVACCTASAVPARVAEQAPPAAASAAVAELPTPPPSAAPVLHVRPDAESPPGPPGRLHLLYGCFLT